MASLLLSLNGAEDVSVLRAECTWNRGCVLQQVKVVGTWWLPLIVESMAAGVPEPHGGLRELAKWSQRPGNETHLRLASQCS